MPRPVLYVLAGVNGAGKSSIGGRVLLDAGLSWFNPDTFARELVALSGCEQSTANGKAWQEGLRRLDTAIAASAHHAFETTLGGTTIASRIDAATATHDVVMWFCGLDSPGHHIARVRARVAAGGHDIPDDRIRQRYPRALANVIGLMPKLAHLKVYDNSADAARAAPIPDPILICEMRKEKLVWPSPRDEKTLRGTPEWAKPIVAAALEYS
jgi:predicted ABC-type ATPase